MLANAPGILADEMGLGKTVQTLALIASDFDGEAGGERPPRGAGSGRGDGRWRESSLSGKEGGAAATGGEGVEVRLVGRRHDGMAEGGGGRGCEGCV